MEIVTGVFQTRREAEEALQLLSSLGIPNDRIGLLTPDMTERQVETSVRTTDSEAPGMGGAMGSAVGAALGIAGGASLGLAAASLVVPGIGPVLAVGLIGAALLGAGGAATGLVVGESLEEALGEGLPHEDLYVFEEALRRGRSVVISYAEEGDQADRARDVMRRLGAEDIDAVRENWWRDRKDEERRYYETNGGDFAHDELSYRRGFQGALHPKRRGKSFAEAERELQTAYGENEVDSAFKHGYERGRSYHEKVRETRKV
jgi:hypothetical protein